MYATKLTWQGVKSTLKRAGFQEATARYSGTKYDGFEVSERGKGIGNGRWHTVDVSYIGKWVHHWHAWTDEERAAWRQEHDGKLLEYATALSAAGYAVRVEQQRFGYGDDAETTPRCLTVTLN